jgi:hypothetical protein
MSVMYSDIARVYHTDKPDEYETSVIMLRCKDGECLEGPVCASEDQYRSMLTLLKANAFRGEETDWSTKFD